MTTIPQILKNEPRHYKDAEELSHGNEQQDYQNLSSLWNTKHCCNKLAWSGIN